jgi:DNA gyrase/topoisomerase IV subunit A
MDSSTYLKDTSREYAIYVCSSRAIPAIQDGLKTGQRIALWLLRNRSDKIKTVALGGEMAAQKLYVHGDVSANNAINLLAAPYKNNLNLIEGLGQFGSRVAPVEGIGAPRYTEVRRSKAAQAFLYNDLDLVPLIDNYDGSNKQPKHFLPLIPTVLLNGVEGVAVGWSTSILPRSFKGLLQATLDALDERKVLRGLDPHHERYRLSMKILAPNKYEFSGQAVIEDTSTVRITELPTGLSIDAFRERLIAMEDSDVIQTFIDRSTESIDVVVKFKRGAVKDWDVDMVLDFFKLREKVTERIVVVDWSGSAIKTYSDPQDLVRDFVTWRLGWYRTRFEKKRDDAGRELVYWQALKALFEGGFTKKLGTFDNRKALEDSALAILTKAKIEISDSDLDRIVNLPTFRWTKDFEADVAKKIKSISDDITEYLRLLADETALTDVYRAELNELKTLKL